MGRSCREIHEWIEEEIEQPIEDWEDRQEQRCRNEPCNWWLLCLNKLVCWFVWVTVKVIRWVVVTVGKWVVRVVCEVVNFVLDVIGFIIGLILSIPIIGGIIRTVLNWVLEVIWRIVGVIDLLGSLLGIRPRKKFYFGVIIPVIDGTPIATQVDIQPQVDATIIAYDQTCNIDARFTGFCRTEVSPPGGSIVVNCDAGGFFEDWWIKGSWFEFVSRVCKFRSNWRNILGVGGELYAFVVNSVEPNRTIGCSFAGTTNWIAIESGVDVTTMAHEFGHAFLLGHNDSTNTNLMFPSTTGTGPADVTLTNWQISVIRTSRHVVYL